MIIAKSKADKLSFISALEKVMELNLFPGLTPEQLGQVQSHLHAMRNEAHGSGEIFATLRFETYPERKATAIWWELSFKNPVVESGKRIEQ